MAGPHEYGNLGKQETWLFDSNNEVVKKPAGSRGNLTRLFHWMVGWHRISDIYQKVQDDVDAFPVNNVDDVQDLFSVHKSVKQRTEVFNKTSWFSQNWGGHGNVQAAQDGVSNHVFAKVYNAILLSDDEEQIVPANVDDNVKKNVKDVVSQLTKVDFIQEDLSVGDGLLRTFALGLGEAIDGLFGDDSWSEDLKGVYYKLADMGFPLAQFRAAQLAEEAGEVDQAVAYYEEAGKQGVLQAHQRLVTAHREGELNQDVGFEKAFKHECLAARKNVGDRLNLATRYLTGQGTGGVRLDMAKDRAQNVWDSDDATPDMKKSAIDTLDVIDLLMKPAHEVSQDECNLLQAWMAANVDDVQRIHTLTELTQKGHVAAKIELAREAEAGRPQYAIELYVEAAKAGAKPAIERLKQIRDANGLNGVRLTDEQLYALNRAARNTDNATRLTFALDNLLGRGCSSNLDTAEVKVADLVTHLMDADEVDAKALEQAQSWLALIGQLRATAPGNGQIDIPDAMVDEFIVHLFKADSDEETVRAALKSLADAAHPLAQYALAKDFDGEKNEAAKQWFVAAANQGVVQAGERLARTYGAREVDLKLGFDEVQDFAVKTGSYGAQLGLAEQLLLGKGPGFARSLADANGITSMVLEAHPADEQVAYRALALARVTEALAKAPADITAADVTVLTQWLETVCVNETERKNVFIYLQSEGVVLADLALADQKLRGGDLKTAFELLKGAWEKGARPAMAPLNEFYRGVHGKNFEDPAKAHRLTVQLRNAMPHLRFDEAVDSLYGYGTHTDFTNALVILNQLYSLDNVEETLRDQVVALKTVMESLQNIPIKEQPESIHDQRFKDFSEEMEKAFPDEEKRTQVLQHLSGSGHALASYTLAVIKKEADDKGNAAKLFGEAKTQGLKVAQAQIDAMSLDNVGENEDPTLTHILAETLAKNDPDKKLELIENLIVGRGCEQSLPLAQTYLDELFEDEKITQAQRKRVEAFKALMTLVQVDLKRVKGNDQRIEGLQLAIREASTSDENAGKLLDGLVGANFAFANYLKAVELLRGEEAGHARGKERLQAAVDADLYVALQMMENLVREEDLEREQEIITIKKLEHRRAEIDYEKEDNRQPLLDIARFYRESSEISPDFAVRAHEIAMKLKDEDLEQKLFAAQDLFSGFGCELNLGEASTLAKEVEQADHVQLSEPAGVFVELCALLQGDPAGLNQDTTRLLLEKMPEHVGGPEQFIHALTTLVNSQNRVAQYLDTYINDKNESEGIQSSVVAYGDLAALNVPAANVRLFEILRDGERGHEVNKARAKEHLQAAVDADHLDAIKLMEQVHRGSWDYEENVEAAHQLALSVVDKSPEARFAVAKDYFLGAGVDQSFETAMLQASQIIDDRQMPESFKEKARHLSNVIATFDDDPKRVGQADIDALNAHFEAIVPSEQDRHLIIVGLMFHEPKNPVALHLAAHFEEVSGEGDQEAARQLYDQAAAKGLKASIQRLERAYRNGELGLEKNENLAFQSVARLSDTTDLESKLIFAQRCFEGAGVYKLEEGVNETSEQKAERINTGKKVLLDLVREVGIPNDLKRRALIELAKQYNTSIGEHLGTVWVDARNDAFYLDGTSLDAAGDYSDEVNLLMAGHLFQHGIDDNFGGTAVAQDRQMAVWCYQHSGIPEKWVTVAKKKSAENDQDGALKLLKKAVFAEEASAFEPLIMMHHKGLGNGADSSEIPALLQHPACPNDDAMLLFFAAEYRNWDMENPSDDDIEAYWKAAEAGSALAAIKLLQCAEASDLDAPLRGRQSDLEEIAKAAIEGLSDKLRNVGGRVGEISVSESLDTLTETYQLFDDKTVSKEVNNLMERLAQAEDSLDIAAEFGALSTKDKDVVGGIACLVHAAQGEKGGLKNATRLLFGEEQKVTKEQIEATKSISKYAMAYVQSREARSSMLSGDYQRAVSLGLKACDEGIDDQVYASLRLIGMDLAQVPSFVQKNTYEDLVKKGVEAHLYYIDRAVNYENSGKQISAATMYRKALEADPGNAQAKAALVRLIQKPANGVNAKATEDVAAWSEGLSLYSDALSLTLERLSKDIEEGAISPVEVMDHLRYIAEVQQDASLFPDIAANKPWAEVSAEEKTRWNQLRGCVEHLWACGGDPQEYEKLCEKITGGCYLPVDNKYGRLHADVNLSEAVQNQAQGYANLATLLGEDPKAINVGHASLAGFNAALDAASAGNAERRTALLKSLAEADRNPLAAYVYAQTLDAVDATKQQALIFYEDAAKQGLPAAFGDMKVKVEDQHLAADRKVEAHQAAMNLADVDPAACLRAAQNFFAGDGVDVDIAQAREHANTVADWDGADPALAQQAGRLVTVCDAFLQPNTVNQEQALQVYDGLAEFIPAADKKIAWIGGRAQDNKATAKFLLAHLMDTKVIPDSDSVAIVDAYWEAANAGSPAAVERLHAISQAPLEGMDPAATHGVNELLAIFAHTPEPIKYASMLQWAKNLLIGSGVEVSVEGAQEIAAQIMGHYGEGHGLYAEAAQLQTLCASLQRPDFRDVGLDEIIQAADTIVAWIPHEPQRRAWINLLSGGGGNVAEVVYSLMLEREQVLLNDAGPMSKPFAINTFKGLAEQGSLAAMQRLAQIYTLGQLEITPEKAHEVATQLATQDGVPREIQDPARLRMAMNQLQGSGTETNLGNAATSAQQLANDNGAEESLKEKALALVGMRQLFAVELDTWGVAQSEALIGHVKTLLPEGHGLNEVWNELRRMASNGENTHALLSLFNLRSMERDNTAPLATLEAAHHESYMLRLEALEQVARGVEEAIPADPGLVDSVLKALTATARSIMTTRVIDRARLRESSDLLLAGDVDGAFEAANAVVNQHGVDGEIQQQATHLRDIVADLQLDYLLEGRAEQVKERLVEIELPTGPRIEAFTALAERGCLPAIQVLCEEHAELVQYEVDSPINEARLLIALKNLSEQENVPAKLLYYSVLKGDLGFGTDFALSHELANQLLALNGDAELPKQQKNAIRLDLVRDRIFQRGYAPQFEGVTNATKVRSFFKEIGNQAETIVREADEGEVKAFAQHAHRVCTALRRHYNIPPQLSEENVKDAEDSLAVLFPDLEERRAWIQLLADKEAPAAEYFLGNICKAEADQENANLWYDKAIGHGLGWVAAEKMV